MLQFRPFLVSISTVSLLTASLWTPAFSQTAEAVNDEISQGKEIAFDRQKGNCLACHAMEGGELPGNIGPPLINMKDRYPNKQRLRTQIWDATIKNPNTIMPPFGRHQILTEEELNKVVEFVYTL